ncbi:MAG TPA: hypothetical protein DCK79_00085 [Candidatus Atribacteria bacterium]|jgi:cytochrome bd-type quinol oxidase subunit 2|nr:MAG: Uncharacterized protein XD79_0213 [Atribacteria bacterium 34_128]HAJ31774.1 hypothetical protein [Candidatus Atribacteria bacterium]
MLYAYIIIISIIIGLARNGKLSSLSQISLKRIELIVLACLIQAGLVFLEPKKVKFVLDYSSYMIIFSYIVLLLAVWYNKELKGMNFITLGIIFNFVVIIANGGHMPVLLSSLYKAGLDDFALVLKEGTYVTHTLITEKTLFRFLADVIPLSPPLPDPSVVSAGDFLMFYGVFSLIQNAMVKKQNSEEREKNSEDKELNPEA